MEITVVLFWLSDACRPPARVPKSTCVFTLSQLFLFARWSVIVTPLFICRRVQPGQPHLCYTTGHFTSITHTVSLFTSVDLCLVLITDSLVTPPTYWWEPPTVQVNNDEPVWMVRYNTYTIIKCVCVLFSFFYSTFGISRLFWQLCAQWCSRDLLEPVLWNN